MITFPCDRCGRTIEVEPERAGEKMECPDCGDMNRIPEAADRAMAAGLPPDSGPEQSVWKIHPSTWRSRPFTFLACFLVPIIAPIAVFFLMNPDSANRGNITFWTFLVLVILGWGAIAIWWLQVTLSHALEITNKRTVLRTGLFSRSTTEVMHDHVRNIQIKQSFIDRILDVGDIGISSSGQDGVEVEAKHIPKPNAVKQIVDRYRPM